MPNPLERKLVPCKRYAINYVDERCWRIQGLTKDLWPPECKACNGETLQVLEPLEDYAARLRGLLEAAVIEIGVWCRIHGIKCSDVDCGTPECHALILKAAEKRLAKHEAERTVENG